METIERANKIMGINLHSISLFIQYFAVFVCGGHHLYKCAELCMRCELDGVVGRDE